jgi:hypothetical protein
VAAQRVSTVTAAQLVRETIVTGEVQAKGDGDVGILVGTTYLGVRVLGGHLFDYYGLCWTSGEIYAVVEYG